MDVTVVSPLSEAQSVSLDGKIVGKYALHGAAAKDKKHGKACDNAGGLGFLAFAADVCGILSRDAYGLLQRFSIRGEERTLRPYSEIISLCRRKISFAIQLGVSNQFLLHASFPAGKYKDGDAAQLSSL